MDDGHICDIQLNVSKCDDGYGSLQWFEVVGMSRSRGAERKVNAIELWNHGMTRHYYLLPCGGELDVSLASRTRRSYI